MEMAHSRTRDLELEPEPARLITICREESTGAMAAVWYATRKTSSHDWTEYPYMWLDLLGSLCYWCHTDYVICNAATAVVLVSNRNKTHFIDFHSSVSTYIKQNALTCKIQSVINTSATITNLKCLLWTAESRSSEQQESEFPHHVVRVRGVGRQDDGRGFGVRVKAPFCLHAHLQLHAAQEWGVY